ARFSSEFISALLRDFRQGGPAAIAKVRKHQPAAYMKICALLVPKEMKLEHSGGVKAMTTEQIERGFELIKEMLAQREVEPPMRDRSTSSRLAPPLRLNSAPLNAGLFFGPFVHGGRRGAAHPRQARPHGARRASAWWC